MRRDLGKHKSPAAIAPDPVIGKAVAVAESFAVGAPAQRIGRREQRRIARTDPPRLAGLDRFALDRGRGERRSEARRVGKEWVSNRTYLWPPQHSKKTKRKKITKNTH